MNRGKTLNSGRAVGKQLTQRHGRNADRRVSLPCEPSRIVDRHAALMSRPNRLPHL